MVESYWNQTETLFHSTSALFCLGNKLKGLKSILRSPSNEKLEQLLKKTKEAYIVGYEKQKENLMCPSSEAIKAEGEALEREKISRFGGGVL